MTAGPLTRRLAAAADAADADPDTDGVWLTTAQVRALLDVAHAALVQHDRSVSAFADGCPVCGALIRLEETP